MTRRLISLAALALLAGCSTVGPDYHPPAHSAATEPAATDAFASGHDAAYAYRPLPDHWWRLYDDPRLDALVEQALSANADLSAADANLRRADAVVRETAAGRSIITELSGGATLARPSGTGESLPGVLSNDLGFSAGYPLDLRGKIRRARSRRAKPIARRSPRRATQCASASPLRPPRPMPMSAPPIIGSPSPGDRQAATRDARCDGAPATRRPRNGLRRQPRPRRGRRQRSDVARLHRPAPRCALFVGDAARPAAGRLSQGHRAMRDAPHAHALDAGRRRRRADPPPPGYPRGGTHHRRRHRADRRCDGRSLSVDPPRWLGGPVRTAQAHRRADLVRLQLRPADQLELPNRPVVRARISEANAQVEADLARLDSTVLDALRETETALETYARARDEAAALARARDSAAVSAAQAGKLFRFGRGDFLSLLEGQSSLAQAEAAHAAAEARLVDDQIALFMALGGGWR